jgi:hypothetical protein
MAKPADRIKDGYLLIRITGVDQGQPVVALDQESICHPHRDDVHTFDHTLHGSILPRPPWPFRWFHSYGSKCD